MAGLASSLPLLVLLAGVGQLVLILASLAIPRVLRWHDETAKLRPLTRQVFWTYAISIWCTNLAFGLVSLRPDWLLDRIPLAACVTGFITAYWVGRVLIQFFYFDRSDTPPGLLIRLAEAALVTLFVYLSLVYAARFAGAGRARPGAGGLGCHELGLGGARLGAGLAGAAAADPVPPTVFAWCRLAAYWAGMNSKVRRAAHAAQRSK